MTQNNYATQGKQAGNVLGMAIGALMCIGGFYAAWQSQKLGPGWLGAAGIALFCFRFVAWKKLKKP